MAPLEYLHHKLLALCINFSILKNSHLKNGFWMKIFSIQLVNRKQQLINHVMNKKIPSFFLNPMGKIDLPNLAFDLIFWLKSIGNSIWKMDPFLG